MEGDGIGGGTPMFAIFVISLLSLFLIPFTIYRLCNAADGEAVKPWETVRASRLFDHSLKRCKRGFEKA